MPDTDISDPEEESNNDQVVDSSSEDQASDDDESEDLRPTDLSFDLKHIRTQPRDVLFLLGESSDPDNVESDEQMKRSTDEKEIYLGLILKMRVIGLSRYNMYWSNEYRISSVADQLSKTLFCDINWYLHFADNSCIVRPQFT